MSETLDTLAEPSDPSTTRSPNFTPWSRLTHLPPDGDRSITELLLIVKGSVCPGRPLMSREKQGYANEIFHNWDTGRITDRPAPYSGNLLSAISVEVGILADDAPRMEDRSRSRLPRRVGSTPITNHGVSQVVPPHRLRGQPVRLVARWQETSGFTFRFCDKLHGWLADEQPVVYTRGTQENAFLRAMLAWDRHCVSTSSNSTIAAIHGP